MDRIQIKNYKSIQSCELELGKINVLVGANGSGKSNFISFFKLVRDLLEGRLAWHITKHGGPDAALHYGRKNAKVLSGRLESGADSYAFELEAAHDNKMMFHSEKGSFVPNNLLNKNGGYYESRLLEKGFRFTMGAKDWESLSQQFLNWRIYHFNDTSADSEIKRQHPINDNRYLKTNGSNLAAFLYKISRSDPKKFREIERAISLAAPFFRKFALRPVDGNDEMIELEWYDQGGDTPFKAHQLSDGTLRFICLCTALLQPESLRPKTIIIDEPELGLHPFALSNAAEMIHSVSFSTQVIISTQSPDLLSQFELEDVIVAERINNATILRKLEPAKYEHWLKNYTLGEIWDKNIFGGAPC